MKKNQKKHSDIEWIHKCSCFKHEIAPIIRNHFSNDKISGQILQSCSCPQYKGFISDIQPLYTCSLLDIVREQKPWTTKNALFAQMNIQINIDLLQGMTGEIKKLTQPNTRKNILATGSFWRDEIIMRLGHSTYFVRFKLFHKFILKQIDTKQIDKKRLGADIAKFWYDTKLYIFVHIHTIYIYINNTI